MLPKLNETKNEALEKKRNMIVCLELSYPMPQIVTKLKSKNDTKLKSKLKLH